MAGRPGRRARPLALTAAATLAATLAGSALAGPLPRAPVPPGPPAALPEGSVETPGRNELVSTPQVGAGAVQTGTSSRDAADIFAAPTISGDGRYVVFLQQRQVRGGNELVLRDRRAETTTVLDESDGSYPLDQPTISANGRWIAYVRRADVNDIVVLMDRTTGEPQPLDPPGRYRGADQPTLSRDGRYVALRAVGLEGTEVLLYDRTTGGWEVVSADVEGRPISQYSGADAAQPAISGDGRHVAFTATATFAQLVFSPKPTNDFRQVFVRDRESDATAMISLTPQGQQGLGHSFDPAFSDNGRVVAFATVAADLVADDTNQVAGVVAWTRGRDTLELVSRSTDGDRGNASSAYPAVSADGSQVAFVSAATTLVPGDSTGGQASTPGLAAVVQVTVLGDIFVRDRGADRTSRVSVGRDNESEPNGVSAYPSVSSTARYVAFTSVATNLIRADRNETAPDVFVRERPPRIAAGPNPVEFGAGLIGSLGTTRSATIRSTGITAARIGDITVGGTHASDFFVSSNPCTGQSLPRGETCEVGVLFVATAKGDRRATLRIESDAGTVTLRLVASAGSPKLKVEPESGPPGIVVVATGTGFPTNAPITLAWSTGLTATPLEPVVSDAKGAFRAQVLVMPRDRTGRRNLRATATVPGLTLDPVTARFLVVPSTMQPPTSGLVQVFSTTPGDPIILRR